MEKGPEVFLADATLYLELFGIVIIAWQWLRQAVAARAALDGRTGRADADFYAGKILTARYFFAYELPKVDALARRLTDNDPLTLEATPAAFAD
jgi:butyryl-CoA dehydrogenase